MNSAAITKAAVGILTGLKEVRTLTLTLTLALTLTLTLTLTPAQVSHLHARYGRRAEQDSHEVLRHLLEGIRSEEVRPLG